MQEPISLDEIKAIDAYWRACNYLCVGMIYLRDNPLGPHDEWWLHSAGCRQWFRVRRDTRTHDILGTAAPGAPLPRAAP